MSKARDLRDHLIDADQALQEAAKILLGDFPAKEADQLIRLGCIVACRARKMARLIVNTAVDPPKEDR